MDISFNTPALLFPAISLLMLAYTNRFLALASLIRKLHSEYKGKDSNKDTLKVQIANLRRRLVLVKQMQACGVLSFFCCVLTMLFIYLNHEIGTNSIFALSLIFLLVSQALSLHEIFISTKALEIELTDIGK